MLPLDPIPAPTGSPPSLPRRSLAVMALWLACFATPVGAIAQEKGVPTELSLEVALQFLLEADPVILQHRESVAMARGDFEQAGRALNPSLEVSSEGYDFGANGARFLDRQEFVVGIGKTFELGGKRGERSRTARERLRAAESTLADVVRRRRLELARRYFGLALAIEQLELARGLRADFDRLLEAARDRSERGEASGLEVFRLRTERLRFVERELDAELAASEGRIELAEILGEAALPETLRLTDELATGPSEAAPDELPTAVDPSRPDLRAAEARVTAAEASLENERSQAVPDLHSFVGFMRDFDRSSVALSFSVELPVADRNQGAVSRARAMLTAAQLDLRVARLRANAELGVARAQADVGRRRVASLRDDGTVAASRAREIAQGAYRLGSIGLTDVLDAERAYREMLGSYLSALYALRIAEASVLSAAGVWP